MVCNDADQRGISANNQHEKNDNDGDGGGDNNSNSSRMPIKSEKKRWNIVSIWAAALPPHASAYGALASIQIPHNFFPIFHISFKLNSSLRIATIE